MTARIQFLGAARTVTGSKYLVEVNDKRILIDCGAFQGGRKLREQNWNDPDFPLNSVDAVLLTHAHIDHTGLLPRYVAKGLSCPVYCTSATQDLCSVLLPDMAYLQEQEAKYRAERNKSRHIPPLPLYTGKDAAAALKLFSPVAFNTPVEVAPGVTATWTVAGHILGAGCITLEVGTKRITFSGDLGRYTVPILKDPHPVDFGNLLLIESTYAGRSHPNGDLESSLEDTINRTVDRKGVVVIPSFAVGRAQLLLYHLRELKEAGRIPDVPVIVDSPMATDATHIYKGHPECFDDEALGVLSRGAKPFEVSKLAFTRETSASIALNDIKQPMIIISASGMLTGGRILHHLRHRIGHEENTILFVGHQPRGGRGWWIQQGNPTLRLFGDEYTIRAEIETLSGLSAHADEAELLQWCHSCSGTPDAVAVVHGEEESCEALAGTLGDQMSWSAKAPHLGDSWTL